MTFNHRYRFLFVHIQKTAGTSIRESLRTLEGTVVQPQRHTMLQFIDPEPYRGYFRFCFVRNPFDRLVSWWNMLTHLDLRNEFTNSKEKGTYGLSEFLDRAGIIHETRPHEPPPNLSDLKPISFNQLDYITDAKGQLGVDFIGRFERLEQDFRHVCNCIGADLALPHLNRFDHRHYREYYNAGDVEKVRRLCQRDLDFFGYEF